MKLQDLVAPVDHVAKKHQEINLTKGALSQQVKEKDVHHKTDGGKFFGMTDEEILLHQDVFKQMGLL